MVLLGLTGALATACGRYEKQPVEDLPEMREEAKKIKNMTEAELQAKHAEKQRKEAERVAREQAIRERDQKIKELIERGPEKGNDIIVEKVVEKPVEVIKEQATVDDKYVVITTEPILQFIESQKGSYQILARSLVKGMKVELTATNLPEGVKLEKLASENENVKYALSWTPSLYTVPANTDVKFFTAKLLAKVVEAPAGKNKAALQNLMKEKEALLVVSRLKQSPNSLKLDGLESEIQAGTLIPFSVTAIVPGVDDKAPAKPFLTVFYDGQDYIAGSPQIELDGSRHVIIDQGRTQAEYLGDFKWKFSMLYDTQKISVQPARGKDRNVLANAAHTSVRVSFRVTNPMSMLASPPILKQIKIKVPSTPSTGGAQ